MGVHDQVKTITSDAFTQYYTMATQMLYYYDYILTLPDEVLFTPCPFCVSFTVL